MTAITLAQIFWAAIAVGVAIFIQIAGFTMIIRLLKRLKARRTPADRFLRGVAIGLTMYLLFLLHLTQILVYGMVYYWTGALSTLQSAFYFSAATFTTIGGGDVRTAEPWQLFAALQGLSGIVLVGTSVSFLVVVVHQMRFWADELDGPP